MRKSNLKSSLVSIYIGIVIGLVLGLAIIAVDILYESVSCGKQFAIESVEAVADLKVDMEAEQERLDIQEQQRANVEANNKAYAEQIEVLARCVEAEAGNQTLDVKRAVVAVIMNRVDDEDWPDSISEVISDPYEFATYWNGRMNEVTPSEDTYEAIQMEMETRSYPGLYYFDMDKYLLYGTPYKQMGDLYFSTK